MLPPGTVGERAGARAGIGPSCICPVMASQAPQRGGKVGYEGTRGNVSVSNRYVPVAGMRCVGGAMHVALRKDAERIIEGGVIAVIRAVSEDVAIRIAHALVEGGIKVIEITFTVPGAHRVLEFLARRTEGEDVMLGAGTVLDAETARISLLAGARFIVSPALTLEVVQLAHRYNVLAIPGTATPTEILEARNAGVDMVKIFPGNVLGPEFVRAVKPLFPGLYYIVTGGIKIDNIEDWIKAGAVAVGLGGELTSPAKVGDYAEVTRRARAAVKAVRDARSC